MSRENSRILWDRIVSIEYCGYEQVYDIEVEGTHNFVAGHFVDVAAERSSASSRDVAAERSSAPWGKASFAATSSRFFGGIIAHNTYISSAAGIVNPPPSGDQLYVAGNAGISGNLTVGGTVSYSQDLTLSGGAVSLIDGTAQSPSLNFVNNADTGLFRPAAETIAFTTAGTEDMRIANGNVGIGTTSPTRTLDVIGNAAISTDLTISGAINVDSGTLFVNQEYDRVGIGTTNPTAKLDIAGTGSSTISNSSGDLTITPASNLIISTGNVGIGTTSPNSKLDVVGGAASVASDQRINLEGASGDTYLAFNSSGPYISFYVNNTEVARLKP